MAPSTPPDCMLRYVLLLLSSPSSWFVHAYHLMSNFVQVKMATGLPGVPLVLVIRPVGEVLE